VAVHKSKPRNTSPVFEKANLDRLKKCSATAESAKRLIEESKRLAQKSHELTQQLHKKRKAS
jgi:hypothetical protein